MPSQNIFIRMALGGMVCACLAAPAASQTLLNGSLTGTPAEGSVPASWFTGTQGADTVAAGGLSSPSGPGGFHAWQLSASPDGGTFVSAFFRAGGATDESFSQTVTGLVTGQTYRIGFWQANAGWYQGSSVFPNEVASGRWTVSLGAASAATSALSFQGFGAQTWGWAWVDLVAAAPSAVLTLRPQFVAAGTVGVLNDGRLAIDGLSISAVPEPASWALWLAGAGLLAALRRRR